MKLQDLNLENLLKKTDVMELIDVNGKIRHFTEFTLDHPNLLTFWRESHYVCHVGLDEEIILTNKNYQIQTVDEEGQKIWLTFCKFDAILLGDENVNPPGRADNECLEALKVS